MQSIGSRLAGPGMLVFACLLPDVAVAEVVVELTCTDSFFPVSAIALSGIAIMFVSELLRSCLARGLVERIPRRWRIGLPIALSLAAGLLWSLQKGVTRQEALYVGLFAGPTAVFAHEVLIEAILGHANDRGHRAA